MLLSPENLRILKEPFGLLLENKSVNKVRLHNSVTHAKMIVSVGDATTDRVTLYGIVPNLCVVDGKERRLQRRTAGGDSLQDQVLQLRCSNPARTISKGAVQVLRDAVKASSTNPVRVIVEGEEDLLALPIFLLVPFGSIVMYGQPLKGIVLVKIDPETRKRAKDLMESLGIDWIGGYDEAVAE
jgi:GTP-dependent dephospho-CoA kinase